MDSISRRVSTALRKFQDVTLKIVGTKTQILRIQHSVPDIFGHTDETLRRTVINNVVIAYPFNNVEIYGKRDTPAGPQYRFRALDMWEFLPISVKVPFFASDNSESGTYEDTPVDLEVGDLIVDVVFDHVQTKIPIVMEITRARGTFNHKDLAGRDYEAALKRGTLNPDIKWAIRDYVDGVQYEG
jgi:hypothetical protein